MINWFVLFSSLSFSLLFGEIPLETLQTLPPMHVVFHPISTNNAEAQYRFNRGLSNIYAFNHDIAYQEFEKASQLDPTLAMAYWGMALALGQNINSDVTPENEIKAYALAQRALQLSGSASNNEQAYIKALATRYTNDPQADLVPLRFTYRTAMQQVVKAYPEDLDAATLYAESILDLYPWKWWSPEGKPHDGTLEAVAMLESVLDRNPQHLGANHYYIHAMEASPYPERALMSAQRLETLFTESGHLLHMPSHIYLLVGDYESALKANLRAIATDKNYIQAHGLGGTYPVHYLSHNMDVLIRTYMLMGDFNNAYKTALELNQLIAHHVKTDDNLNHYAYVPLEVLLYFHKWQEILAFQPLAQESPVIRTQLHFARGMAYAHQNMLESAQKELEQLTALKQNMGSQVELGNNLAAQVFEVAALSLQAAIERQTNRPAAINTLRKAALLQDDLYYGEPPDWYIPLRQSLGAVLIQEGLYQESEEAFRVALNHLQRNGRLLFGLHYALKAQKKLTDAYWVEREMLDALKFAPEPLSLSDL